MTEVAHIFYIDTFPLKKKITQKGLSIFWAIFSQTHLVTLIGSSREAGLKCCQWAWWPECTRSKKCNGSMAAFTLARFQFGRLRFVILSKTKLPTLVTINLYPI
jgi:hypothetical protein